MLLTELNSIIFHLKNKSWNIVDNNRLRFNVVYSTNEGKEMLLNVTCSLFMWDFYRSGTNNFSFNTSTLSSIGSYKP